MQMRICAHEGLYRQPTASRLKSGWRCVEHSSEYSSERDTGMPIESTSLVRLMFACTLFVGWLRGSSPGSPFSLRAESWRSDAGSQAHQRHGVGQSRAAFLNQRWHAAH
jgi:hypothetical protein